MSAALALVQVVDLWPLQLQQGLRVREYPQKPVPRKEILNKTWPHKN
jgi:hypothetical protein